MAHISTTSPWRLASPPGFNPLLTHTTADVCVIGAGISGLSVAYELMRLGLSVVVLDERSVGGGQTLNTTAHLVTALDERYFELERVHGEAGAALARESHSAAIDRIEAITRESSIDCRFARIDGHIFVPPERADSHELLDRELAAARRAGATAEKHDSTPQLAVPAPSLRFPDQAQVHPLMYIAGLARAIRAGKGRIFTGTQVARYDGGADPLVTTVDNLRISCGAVLVATNTPIAGGRAAQSETPFCSYVIALRIEPGSMSPALYWDGYWDDDSAYHYARLASSPFAAPDAPDDLLLVGGEDHEGEQPDLPDPRYERLEEWARLHFNRAGSVTHRWYGRILEPDDELAYIGRHPRGDDNLYVISGDSGNGMTYAAIAGMMIPSLIRGGEHRWSRIYDPNRSAAERPTRRSITQHFPSGGTEKQ